MKKKFCLDKDNAMFLGVCSGLARYIGVDATIVRIGAVLVTLFGAFPWTFVAYGVAAWLAKPEGWRGRRTDAVGTAAATADCERERRLTDVDRYVAGSESSLAREIEALR